MPSSTSSTILTSAANKSPRASSLSPRSRMCSQPSKRKTFPRPKPCAIPLRPTSNACKVYRTKTAASISGNAASSAQITAIRHHLNNRATETAGAAHFADSYSDGAYTVLQSDRRTDGVLLDALITDQPQSDLIPKLVRGLLGGRTRGHWMNTQENVFILLALDRYFNTYEKTTPDFVARVWLGQAYAGEQTFRGRSVDRQQLNLPMSALVERTAKAPTNLVIGKEGAGRLYFRIGAEYA